MLANVSSHEAAVMNETFSKIWAEVRNCVNAGDDENWIGLSRGVGVTKEDLTSAAEKLPSIRDFFMQVLNRRPPKAQEVATPFHMRRCENFRPKSSEKAWRQTINPSNRTARVEGNR